MGEVLANFIITHPADIALASCLFVWRYVFSPDKVSQSMSAHIYLWVCDFPSTPSVWDNPNDFIMRQNWSECTWNVLSFQIRLNDLEGFQPVRSFICSYLLMHSFCDIKDVPRAQQLTWRTMLLLLTEMFYKITQVKLKTEEKFPFNSNLHLTHMNSH